MEMTWEIIESGPADAAKTVLLLPGGSMGAGSYAEVMAEPALAEIRLVAATLPGNAGAPAPSDFRIEELARLTGDLAKSIGADVVAGFSNGANVACEMVTSGSFAGPVVLLGSSFCSADEPAFFRGIVALTSVLGTLPIRLLKMAFGSFVKHTPLPAARQNELKRVFEKNDPHHMRAGLREYVRWLRRGGDRARRLRDARVPTWIVHAERAGDGGLTAQERALLEASDHVRIVTLPGKVFFIPNEMPERVGELILEAAAVSAPA